MSTFRVIPRKAAGTTAGATMTPVVVQARVNCIVGVTLRAMGSRSHMAAANVFGIAAQLINLSRHRFQMVRADAAGHPTQMVDLTARRDGAVFPLVTPAVSINDLPTNGDDAVSATVVSSSPQPAVTEVRRVIGAGAVLIDLRPEPFFYRESRIGMAPFYDPLIMLSAKAPANDGPFAVGHATLRTHIEPPTRCAAQRVATTTPLHFYASSIPSLEAA